MKLEEMRDYITERLGNGKSNTSVKKEDIDEFIATVRQMNSNIILFDKLPKAVRESWKERIGQIKDSYSGIYQQYVRVLNGKASKHENNEFLGTFSFTSSKLMTVLDEIADAVAKDFPKALNLYNAKQSHLVYLGTVSLAMDFAVYASYIQAGLVETVLGKDINHYPYRLHYLEENTKTVANIVTSVYMNSGPMALKHVLNEMKYSGNDLPLLDDNNKPNAFLKQVESKSGKLMVEQGIRNPVFSIGRLFTVWRDMKMKRVEQDREWLEAHLAALKTVLEGVDPDDPEYQNKVKIINNYSRQLAKLDKKLEKYYGSE